MAVAACWIRSATAPGSETVTAWEASISIACDFARADMNRIDSAGMARSSVVIALEQTAEVVGVAAQAAKRVRRLDHRVPVALELSITPFQLDESAKAPWTSTTVGLVVSELVPWVFVFISCILSTHPTCATNAGVASARSGRFIGSLRCHTSDM